VEKSVYIVKPDGFYNEFYMRRMFECEGLRIVDSRAVRVSVNVLEHLYPDLFEEKGELWEATVRHFAERSSMVVVVQGLNAIRLVRKISGENTNPNLCARFTVRFIFGNRNPVVLSDGRFYWMNAIHRPKNKAEVKAHLSLIRHEYGL
jgi:nucleoside diphosphate kinase